MSGFYQLRNILHSSKVVRFLLVSGLNTVFGYGFFALLIFVGLAYPFALLIGTIAGILFNFTTIGGLVFNNHNNRLILKFFGVYGITYLCNLGGLALLKSFNTNTYLSGAILLVPIGFLSFSLNKTFVFKERDVNFIEN